MIDLSDLIAGRERYAKLIGQTVLDVTNKVTLDVHANVITASPVDSGTFRGNWQMERAETPYQNAAVTNATPYGPFLLDGHSKQAPPGWLDNAVQSAVMIGGAK